VEWWICVEKIWGRYGLVDGFGDVGEERWRFKR
jgi:hypothetical protein